MKRFFIFIKILFVLPTMLFTRLHSRKMPLDGRFHLARTWAAFIIRNAAVTVKAENTNLIPLEDGYTFISNHDSKYDGLFLLASNPLDFSFFVKAKERLPYMTPFLKHIDSILFTKESRDDDLIRMSQALKAHRNYHLFLESTEENDTGAIMLDAAYLSKTAIIPVAIKNGKSLMKLGHHQITVSFCTPLHYEEYGSLKPIDTLNEIKQRIKSSLKEG